MTDKPHFYITTAISYPNGAPHIGHAYEAIATDVIARFKRLDGFDVKFLTGTDEHGIKMLQTARAIGLSPRELADRNAPLFKTMVNVLNCSNDDFIRTSEKRHYRASQELWRRMEAAGDIYSGTYAGWYSVRDEAYYDESELIDSADDGKLSPQKTPVEWVEEESFFFRLSAYQERLLDHYNTNPKFIGPDTRRNEVVSFVSRGLRDLSLSRTTFDWGIPVPGAGHHIMYVWVDALTNYLTGVGFPDEENTSFDHYWPADLHVIGKDIVRFHAIYWPAFLMSAGIDLPKRVYAHGFLFNRGEKMSKSIGNVVNPLDMAERYGIDQMRYFLMREVPFGQDGSYSHEAIVTRINADLANDLGNLSQRSLSMIARNCNSCIPQPGPISKHHKVHLEEVIDVLLDDVCDRLDQQMLHDCLVKIWEAVAQTNRYFANSEPWALKKTNPLEMACVLYITAESLRQIAILTQPFMPQAMSDLLDQLGVEQGDRSFSSLGPGHRIMPGKIIIKPRPIFPRYVEVADGSISD